MVHRLLTLRAVVDEYCRQHVDKVRNALELQDWDALAAMCELLEVPKQTSLNLEADLTPTGPRALKYFWRFQRILHVRSRQDSVAVLSAAQRTAVPLAHGMRMKLLEALDDPNWVFAMAFMAYMDPSGEFFVSGTSYLFAFPLIFVSMAGIHRTYTNLFPCAYDDV